MTPCWAVLASVLPLIVSNNMWRFGKIKKIVLYLLKRCQTQFEQEEIIQIIHFPGASEVDDGLWARIHAEVSSRAVVQCFPVLGFLENCFRPFVCWLRLRYVEKYLLKQITCPPFFCLWNMDCLLTWQAFWRSEVSAVGAAHHSEQDFNCSRGACSPLMSFEKNGREQTKSCFMISWRRFRVMDYWCCCFVAVAVIEGKVLLGNTLPAIGCQRSR